MGRSRKHHNRSQNVYNISQYCHISPHGHNLVQPQITPLSPDYPAFFFVGGAALSQYYDPWMNHMSPNTRGRAYAASILGYLLHQYPQSAGLVQIGSNNVTLEVLCPPQHLYTITASTVIRIHIRQSKVMTRKLIFFYHWIAELYGLLIARSQMRDAVRWGDRTVSEINVINTQSTQDNVQYFDLDLF